MKGLILTVCMVLMVSQIGLAKDITVTLSDEQYDAMTVLRETPEEWTQRAIENKADRMINRLIDPIADKKLDKMTKQEKKVLFRTLDLEEEREKRHGKKNP